MSKTKPQAADAPKKDGKKLSKKQQQEARRRKERIAKICISAVTIALAIALIGLIVWRNSESCKETFAGCGTGCGSFNSGCIHIEGSSGKASDSDLSGGDASGDTSGDLDYSREGDYNYNFANADFRIAYDADVVDLYDYYEDMGMSP